MAGKEASITATGVAAALLEPIVESMQGAAQQAAQREAEVKARLGQAALGAVDTLGNAAQAVVHGGAPIVTVQPGAGEPNTIPGVQTGSAVGPNANQGVGPNIKEVVEFPKSTRS